MAQPDLSDNQKICPHCHQLLTTGVKFCETCGAKIEQLPPCPNCGAPLTPGVKFCETCGKAVGGPAPEAGTPETAPAPKEPEPVAPATPPKEVPPVVPAVAETAAEPAQTAEPPVPVTKSPVPQPATPGPAAPGTATALGAGPNKTLIIAGIVGLVVIAALALFVILPSFSGAAAGTTTAGQGAATTTTTAGAMPTAAPAGSFEPLPTDTIPVNLEVTYQADRDPITGLVTVTFTGGPGLNGISATAITLTRSDGHVVTKSFKPKQVGDTATVQGTLQTDRIEVIANFYNGESYRVIDKLFEYKRKNY